MSSKTLAILVMLSLLAAACGGQPAPQTSPLVITLPPGTTPLVTQIGAGPANRLEILRTSGVMRVGVSTDFPPFEYLDAQGERAGLDIELMAEIARRLGVRLEWVDMTFDELLPAVRDNKVDAAISAIRYTEERAQLVDFSAAYYTAEDAFIALESFEGKLEAPEDAAAYLLGVQAGTAQEAWLEEVLIQGGKLSANNLVRYEKVDEGVADLREGKIQLLVADYIPAQRLVKENEGLVIVYHGVVSGGSVHIALPKGETELKAAIDAILQQLIGEGYIQNLAVRYINLFY